MKFFISKWAQFVVQARLYIIVLSLLAVVVGGYYSQFITFDQTIERNFVEGDPRLDEFNQLLDLFGDSEYLVLGVTAPKDKADIFNAETLTVINHLTNFLEGHSAITQVRSISKYQYLKGDSDSLLAEDLFPLQQASDVTQKQIEQARAIGKNEKLVTGVLLSDDLQETRIAARIEYHRESPAHKVALVKELYQFVEEQGFTEKGYRIRYGGQPVFDEQFETRNKADADLLYPIMMVVMILILYLGFRSWVATFVPWLVIIFGIVILMGLQGWLSFPQSAVSQALMPTMIIVGIGVTMHMVLEFYRLRNRGEESADAITHAIEKLWVPSFYTAITTALGFITLSVTEIVTVKEMAYLGAAGVLMLFILAFTLLPAVLSYSKKVTPQTNALLSNGMVTRLTQALPALTFRFRYSILFIAALLATFAAVTLPQLKVDTNFVEYFKEDNQARQDMVYFDDTFNGALTMEVIIDSGVENGIKNPEFLTRVEQLQDYLEGLESTAKINSVIDYLKEVNQSLNNEDPAYYMLPKSPNEVAQLLFLYENAGPEEDLSDLRDFDNRYLRMTVPMINQNASEMQKELDMVKAVINDEYKDLSITLTGILLLFQAQDAYTNEGMFKSFTYALLFVSLFFIVLFRSVKYGLLCIIPSVLPIFITGGAIALLGVNLDLGTMIVGAMTMGIAVDDSIHVMSRYLRAKKSGNSTEESITLAMTEAGRAVVFSSIVLVFGFSVLTLGTFIPIIYVGLFSAVIMFLALLGDLIILPATLYLLDGKSKNVPVLTEQKT